MTEYNVTLDGDFVRRLFLEGYNESIFAEVLEVVFNQLLLYRAEELCGASPYEQTDQRTDYRNGYREREYTTRVGTITLVVLKTSPSVGYWH